MLKPGLTLIIITTKVAFRQYQTSTQNQMFSSTCKMQDYYNPYLKPIFNVDGSRTSMYVHCTVFKIEVVKLNEMIKYHERTVPSWRKEIDESLGNARMVLGKVENRMEEFIVWINHFRECNRNEDIPAEVINSITAYNN